MHKINTHRLLINMRQLQFICNSFNLRRIFHSRITERWKEMDNYSQTILHCIHGFDTQAQNTIIVDDSSSHGTEEQVKELRCIIVFLQCTGQNHNSHSAMQFNQTLE